MEHATITLMPTSPYDFELTAAYATYFRGQYGTETLEDGVFRRLLDISGCLCLVSVRSLGTVDSPSLEAELIGDSLDDDVVAEAQRQVAWILGTDQDLAPFYRMAWEEPVLKPLAQGLRGLHMSCTASVYEGLILAILGQQISAHVARMLRTLLIQTYGPSLQVSGITYYAFPCPETLVAVGVEGLRAIKCSARKAQYIVDIAAGVASGRLDLEGLREQPDEEVIRRLTAIRGVGLWTAQWLLIRALGRADGFPYDDLALQRTLGLLLKGGAPLRPEEALEYSRRWAPFRSYVTTYLFAATRSGRLAELFQVSGIR